MRGDPFADAFGGPLDRCFGGLESGHFGQYFLGSFRKAIAQGARQGDQPLRCRSEGALGQTDLIVPGQHALAAAPAIVVGPLARHVAQHTQGYFLAPAVELGALAALGAEDAGTLVAVFLPPGGRYRPWRLSDERCHGPRTPFPRTVLGLPC